MYQNAILYTLAYITHATLEETGWMFNNPISSSWTHNNNHISQPLLQFRQIYVIGSGLQTWPLPLLQSLCSFHRLLTPDQLDKDGAGRTLWGGSRGWGTPRWKKPRSLSHLSWSCLTRNVSDGLDHENKRNLYYVKAKDQHSWLVQ